MCVEVMDCVSVSPHMKKHGGIIMKKFLLLMLALLVTFSFVACSNDNPAPDSGEDGTIEVPETTEPVTTEIYDDVFEVMTALLSADEGSSERLSTSSYEYYNAGGELLLSSSLTESGERFKVEKDGTYLKAGDTIDINYGVNTEIVFADGTPLDKNERQELHSLMMPPLCAREVSAYSVDFTINTTVNGKTATFSGNVVMRMENSTSGASARLRASVTSENYDGAGDFTLTALAETDNPDGIFDSESFDPAVFKAVAVEVGGKAYSVEYDAATSDLFSLLAGMMG